MSLSYIGSVPCSAVNLGLAASLPALSAEGSQFQADLDDLAASLTSQTDFALNFPPNIAGYLVSFATSLDASAIAAAFNSANWATLNADANLDLVAELGLVDAKIAIVEDIATDIRAGVDAGGLTGWSYAGHARGLGRGMLDATECGFAGTDPSEEINALVVACADFDSWGTFGEGFNAGTSDGEDLGTTTTEARLVSMGTLTGGQWNTGAAATLLRVEAFLAEMQGLKASIEDEIALSIGTNLPDPSVLLDVATSVDLDAALAGMVSAQIDIGAQVSTVQLRLDVVLDLVAELEGQLSTSGLYLWNYSGTAAGLGQALDAELESGLPDGSGAGAAIYGVVIACASPTAWAAFGNICAAG